MIISLEPVTDSGENIKVQALIAKFNTKKFDLT
jgi:hypothetical protein